MEKEVTFCILEVAILNNVIIFTPCGSALSHQLFRQMLVREGASNSGDKAGKTSPIH
jgi:hypothetical protein